MPAISVVLPVYNAAPFLREALDSLLAQTCGDFEAIAVNDGSTDNSLDILQEYAAMDSRIRILDGPNGGYGKAMNRGMDAASGKYMAILEPDDYLPREAYEILLEMADKNRLDVVRGTYCPFYEEGGKRQFRYVIPLRRPGDVFSPRYDLPGVFEFGPHIWTGLYRLAFLREKGIRFHESPGASYQDTGFFFLCAAYADRYMLTDEVTYIYRTNNPGSSVNNIGSKRYALIKEYTHVREQLEKTPEVWEIVQQQYYINRYAGITWVVASLPLVERRAYVEEVQHMDGDWQAERVPAHYQEQLQAYLMADGDSEPVPAEKTEVRRVMAGGLLRLHMSARQTCCYFLGMPVLSRERVPSLRQFRSGITAESDSENVWRFLGLPVRRIPVQRYAEWPANPQVPANVC